MMKAIYDHQFGRVLGIGINRGYAWNDAEARYDFNTGNSTLEVREITDLAVKKLQSVNFDDAEYSMKHVPVGQTIGSQHIKL